MYAFTDAISQSEVLLDEWSLNPRDSVYVQTENAEYSDVSTRQGTLTIPRATNTQEAFQGSVTLLCPGSDFQPPNWEGGYTIL